MKIILSGGTGFLGGALAKQFAQAGRDVVILSRASGRSDSGSSDPSSRQRIIAWTPDGSAGAWARELDDADVVVNLAGAGIADGRWTDDRKRQILNSRIDSTRSLIAALKAATPRSRTFISGSAIGFYGTSETATFDEQSAHGDDFLAGVCAKWEAEAAHASSPSCRVVLLRTGVVLAKDGGALPKMLRPFKLFAGGRVGSGRQWMSWIHRRDWIGLVNFAIDHPAVTGPINLVAPQAVTNHEFSRAIGRALHRPCWLPAPAFALRAMFGEMADALLLSGQHVSPRRALESGFRWHYPDLDTAMRRAVAPPT